MGMVAKKGAWRAVALRAAVCLLAGLLVGYAALLQLVPPPGQAVVQLLPGHDLGAWLDRMLSR